MGTQTDWTKVKINPSQTLLTKAELAKLPALYSQEKVKDPIVLVHYFYGSYDFWATEFDAEEGLFFGLAHLYETELGNTSARELASVGRIERDLYWTPKPLSQCGV